MIRRIQRLHSSRSHEACVLCCSGCGVQPRTQRKLSGPLRANWPKTWIFSATRARRGAGGSPIACRLDFAGACFPNSRSIEKCLPPMIRGPEWSFLIGRSGRSWNGTSRPFRMPCYRSPASRRPLESDLPRQSPMRAMTSSRCRWLKTPAFSCSCPQRSLFFKLQPWLNGSIFRLRRGSQEAIELLLAGRVSD
jgi:hypothetical protein